MMRHQRLRQCGDGRFQPPVVPVWRSVVPYGVLVLGAGMTILGIAHFYDGPPAAIDVGIDVSSSSLDARGRESKFSSADPGTLLARLRALEWRWFQAASARRESVLHEFIADLSTAEATRILDEFDIIVPENLREVLRMSVWRRLAELNPHHAVALAAMHPDPADRESICLEIARQWSQMDPGAAAQWVLNWTGGLPREYISRQLAEQLIDKAPPTAAELISSLNAGEVKSALLDRVLARWATHDGLAALAWAKELPDRTDRIQAMMNLSYRLEGLTLEAALVFAQALPEGHDTLLVSLMNQWIKREPEAAVAWAITQPLGSQRERVLSAITATWSAQDPRAAANFAVQLLNGAEQENAIVSVVSAWSNHQPETTARWVEQFPTGRLREYAIEALLFRWRQSDPPAAAQWLARLAKNGG